MSEISLDYVRDKDWWLAEYPKHIKKLEQQLAAAHRHATEEVAQAHKRGWEQAKMNARDRAEAFAHMGKICCREQADAIKDAIARMEYKKEAKDE